ncbi:MAG: DegV family protein [Defluviitaleaceae bacterium]|nr:DegV family protein [Defluviitaleaceae bacterium]
MSKIITDSCCDMTPDMKKEMGVITVPLTMRLGDNEFRDDESLDVNGFVGRMTSFSGKVGSACPPPFLFQEAIEATDEAYVVTLSSKLSGSYNSAVLANNQAKEDKGTGAAHIFDSKSGAAGQTLIAIKIYELLIAGMSKDRIVETVNRFINSMKTYIVLENYDNLQKNGRLRKITGSLLQLLNIKLIMGSDGNGEIDLFTKCRGTKQVIQRLMSLIELSGRELENLVISHCNNHKLAEHLKTLVKERFNFKKIYVVPAGGLTSLYADNKGIVLAF